MRLSCPRCGVRLPRAEMTKHLWHEHGLALANGKTRTRGQAIAALRREYAATGDPALFDRAADLGGEPAVRAWAAETATEEEARRCAPPRGTAARACARSASRTWRPACRRCRPRWGSRTAGSPGRDTLPPRPARGRRVYATLAAAAALVLVTAVAHVALGFVLAVAAYFATLLRLLPRTPADDRAIDAAWRKLAPALTDRRNAARFLTRLCVTSVGRGDPLERANALQRVIARARATPAERQLLAVALALEMDDGGRFGRDRAAGIADLVSRAFRGEQPADFAEHVLAVYATVPRDAGERARLRVLLHAGAFAAGLSPRDVLDLCDAAPHVAAAMRLPPHHVALLYGVWVHRTAQPWATAARRRRCSSWPRPRRPPRRGSWRCARRAARVRHAPGGAGRTRAGAGDDRGRVGRRGGHPGPGRGRAGRGRRAGTGVRPPAVPAGACGPGGVRGRGEGVAPVPRRGDGRVPGDVPARAPRPAPRLLAPFAVRCAACGTACARQSARWPRRSAREECGVLDEPDA